MSAPAHLVSAPAHQVPNPAHQISAPAYLFYAGVRRLPSFCVSGLYRLTKYLLWLCSGSLNICISSPISAPAHLVSALAHQVSTPAYQISAPAYLFCAGVGRLPSFCVSGLYQLLNICTSSPIIYQMSALAHLVSAPAYLVYAFRKSYAPKEYSCIIFSSAVCTTMSPPPSLSHLAIN